jgi:hypothetical protein
MPVRSEDRLLGLPGVDYGQVAPGAASALLFERQEGQQYPALVFFVEEQGDDAAVRGQVVTPFKQYASATPPGQIPSLASGASAATYANFTGYGSEWAILLAANKACRVTFYSEEAAQIADIGRPFNTPPSGNHGVLLDVQIPTAGGGRRRIVPTAHLYGILPDFALIPTSRRSYRPPRRVSSRSQTSKARGSWTWLLGVLARSGLEPVNVAVTGGNAHQQKLIQHAVDLTNQRHLGSSGGTTPGRSLCCRRIRWTPRRTTSSTRSW